MRAQGEVAAFERIRNSAAIGAKVGSERTAALAFGAVEALAAPLVEVMLARLAEVCAAPEDYVAVAVVFGHDFRKILFDDTALPGGQEISVGQLGDAVFITRYTHEIFHLIVPGGEVSIADRPVYREAVARRSFEVEIAPTLGLAGPHQAFAPYLIAPNPIERLLLDVRMLGVFHEKMRVVFAVSVAPGNTGVGFAYGQRHLAPVLEIPGHFIGGGVVLAVLHVAPALQQQGLDPVVAKLFGGVAAAHARADHDRLVGIVVIHTCRLLVVVDGSGRSREQVGISR